MVLPLNEHFANQKFRISALCQTFVVPLQLFRNHVSLRHGRIFQGSLYRPDRVMLENKIFDSACDDLKKLCHQLRSLVFWHV